MKTSKFIAALLLGIAVTATPVYAQRGGGGGSRGGGHSSSGSSSRSGSSFSGGSRGGSSYSGSSSRGGSYSSSSSSRSYSSPSSSRSSSYYSSPSSSSRSYSSHSSSSGSRSYSSPSPSRGGSYSSSSSSRSYSSPSSSRSSNYTSSERGHSSTSATSSYSSSRRGTATNGVVRGSYQGTRPASVTGSERRPAAAPAGSRSSATTGRPGSTANTDRGTIKTPGSPTGSRGPANVGYAKPGRPGGTMPPAARPVRPAPYFHHPHHHGMIHMHPVFWDPFPPRPLYWPGFWYYCNSYWYDYHCTDVIVVREYVKDNYKVDMIDFAMSGDIMYALVNDSDGKTYLQVYSNEDKLLAEQVVNKKYKKLEIDRENGGCWIFKKNDKDPLLFIYTGEELLIYEADNK